MTEMELWHERGRENGWKMPRAVWWKRLPVIRHIRTWWNMYQVARWYSYGPGTIGIPTGYDNWALVGMWHGLERARTSQDKGEPTNG